MALVVWTGDCIYTDVRWNERGLGMHLIAGLPILVAVALAAISIVTLTDSRIRTIVSWLVLPLLLEGAVVQWLYSNVH